MEGVRTTCTLLLPGVMGGEVEMLEGITGVLGEMRMVETEVVGGTAIVTEGEMAMPGEMEVEMAAETIADKGGQERTVIFTRSVPTLTSTVWERMEIR